jgi:hypothetical protein
MGLLILLRKDGGWCFIIRDDQGYAVCSGAGREDHLLNSFSC